MIGSIPQPRGFKALGKSAGFKKEGELDFAVLASDVTANAAGMFTRNRCPGAPIVVTRDHLSAGGRLRAVVINSRIANVATGEEGIQTARATASLCAEALGCLPTEVAVASTGVIGRRLPLDNITLALDAIGDQLAAFDVESAARAIMTTDGFPKIAHSRVGEATLVGIAKGAGMISPNMATMLAFLMTDAEIEGFLLQAMLRDAVDKSFNLISVDSDTSTSDMVLAMANGLAGPIDQAAFSAALCEVCLTLAKMIARDGEGARHLIECSVVGAGDEGLAERVARAVINSPLVKTAVHGGDPNWGRILAAVGKVADSRIEMDKLSIRIGEDYLFYRGLPMESDRDRTVAHLREESVRLLIDLGRGSAKITMYGCDLSAEYIRINADYTT